MFVEKVERQKLELEQARLRNERLKTRCDDLDKERSAFTHLLITSQIFRAEENETLLMLKKTMTDLVHAIEENNDELNRIESHLNTFGDLEQVDTTKCERTDLQPEELDSLRAEMLKCLQDQLIHVRLNQAEKCAQIQELRNAEQELLREIDEMRKEKPKTEAKLQDELVTYKVREIEVLGQFQNIKETLLNMKQELEELIKERETDPNSSHKSEGTVKINKGMALWNTLDKTKRKECKHEKRIEALDEEKNELFNKIEDLQKNIDIQNKQLLYKSQENQRICDALLQLKTKTKSTEAMITERRRQFEHLKTTGSERIASIALSSEQKDQNINKLTTDMETISQRRHSDVGKKSDLKEANAVVELESTINNLKEKIKSLYEEIMIIQQANENGKSEDT